MSKQKPSIANRIGSAVAHAVVECLTQDRGVAGSSLAGVTVLCPWARHIYPCIVLVQPRKTCPDIAEKLLTGTYRIKSKQTNKKSDQRSLSTFIGQVLRFMDQAGPEF